MKTRLALTCLVLLSRAVSAQEIYKWEDDKGVLHYSDHPEHPMATLFQKDTVPYSQTNALPAASPAEHHALTREEAGANVARPTLTPAPGLVGTDAWLDETGRLHLSGIIYNAGPGVCVSPRVEVVVFADQGGTDGVFATAAVPTAISGGEEAHFAGDYRTPVGHVLSWDAMPRCDSAVGMAYGPRKWGSVSLGQHGTVQLP